MLLPSVRTSRPSARRGVTAFALSCSAVLSSALLSGVVPAEAGTIDRISVNASQKQGNADSYLMTMSSDGRWIAFSSDATNLVPGDTNNWADIFLRDHQTGAVSRINLGPGGVEADSAAVCPVISDDGSVVVYASWAKNLVPGPNAIEDVFLYDVVSGATERISVALAGAGADEVCGLPTVSADGRYVAFYGSAKNLVVGDTNNRDDCFLRDRVTGTTTRITLGMGGVQTNHHSTLPNISADGRYIAYTSAASNIAAGDTNNQWDVFRYDTQTGVTDWVSAGGNNWSNAGGIGVTSADGRFIVFNSVATNLVPNDLNGTSDVFVRDMTLGTTERISQTAGGIGGDAGSYWSVISRDGRFVTYESYAKNLVPGDTNGVSDIFIHDRQTGETIRISQSNAGQEGDANSFAPAISGNGRYVGFYSLATNLVGADTNQVSDLFVHAQCWAATESIGAGLAGTGGVIPSMSVGEGTCFAGGYQVGVNDVIGGALGFLFLGTQLAPQATLGGTFYIDLNGPTVAAAVVFSGPAGSPGAGSVSFPAPDIHAQQGSTWYLQAIAVDPAAPFGVSMTNAARLSIEQ